MTDHRRKTVTDSKANDHPHILLLAGSRAGKGRSIILLALPDGASAIGHDDIDPKPTIGDSHDPAR